MLGRRASSARLSPTPDGGGVAATFQLYTQGQSDALQWADLERFLREHQGEDDEGTPDCVRGLDRVVVAVDGDVPLDAAPGSQEATTAVSWTRGRAVRCARAVPALCVKSVVFHHR